MRIFFAHGGGEAFARWREEQGQPLQDWATWAADRRGARRRLAHLAGGAAPSRRARSSTATRSSTAPSSAFHAWLQWALDLQFTAATGDMTVIQDLPIGVAGGGADAWTWQDVLAEGVSVGAPPDAFNAQGQDWGSPPLIPWRLRDADYEPFIQSIRATIAGAGGLRIDHVMGLFRLWWVPAGGSAAEGAYVRYPSEDLLDIVALESHRAQALVVGEDLGTVEDGVREALAEHGILSYRLLWFEEDAPAAVAGRGHGRHHDARPADGGRALDRRGRRGAAGARHGHRRGARARPDGAARPRCRRCRTAHRWTTRSSRRTAGWPRRRPGCCRRPWTTPSASRDGRTCRAPPTARTGRCRCPCSVEDLAAHPLVQTVARTLADGVQRTAG